MASAQRSGLCHLSLNLHHPPRFPRPPPVHRHKLGLATAHLPPAPSPGLPAAPRGSGTHGSPCSASRTCASRPSSARDPELPDGGDGQSGGLAGRQVTRSHGTTQPCGIDRAGGKRCQEQHHRRAPRPGSAPVLAAALQMLVPEAGAPAASGRRCRPGLGWVRAAETGTHVLPPPHKAWGAFLGTASPCD